MNKQVYLSIVALMFALSLPRFGFARMMKPEEAEVSILEETTKIQVNADGSSSYHNIERVKILNETGRTNWGTRHFNYSPKNARFKIISASTQVGDSHYSVERHDIVDTEINATENGFDVGRQVLVPFRKVEVGSIVSLESKNEVFRPAFDDKFSDRFYVGDYHLQQQMLVEIQSAIPLYFEFNDPNSNLEFTKFEKDQKFKYIVRLKNAMIQRPIEEIRSQSDEMRMTWFQVSSILTAEEVAKPLVEKYENILAQDLPKIFEKIVEGARRESDPIDQINFVLAAVADKIRYMGDWRALDGAFVPRTLKLIGETHFGDCKDLATLTVKILRSLGFESDVAWVFRGKVAPVVTGFGHINFNHAIASVKIKDRQLWVDPTNFQSFAQGVFEDIADRKALVLNAKKIEFRKIEFVPPAESREFVHELISIDSKKVSKNEVKLEDTGVFALGMTGAELKDSKAQIEKAYMDLYTNATDLIKYHFDAFELKSRIVRTVNLNFTFESHFQPTETSLGSAFDFAPPQILRDMINIDRQNRFSDLHLEVPSDVKSVYTLKNVHGKGRGLKNCHIQSPWIDYDFEVSKALNEVTRHLVVKQYVVSLTELKSKAFENFQREVRSCGFNKLLILDLK